jgi:hypothetical protein
MEIDNPKNLEDLIRIGSATGEYLVEPRHFDSQFDL